MKKFAKKALSVVLTMVITLSLLPVQALAEKAEGESVLLPVTDGALMMPVNAFGAGDTTVYASTDAYEVRLPNLQLDSPVGVSSSNARIQVLDTANSRAVGQTATFTLYSSTDEVGHRDLYFFDRLAAGEYPLVLTYGDVTTADWLGLPCVLRVVDAPVIMSGWLKDLSTAGGTLTLDISGYAGDPTHYSFKLVNMETDQEIACLADHRRTEENGYGAATLTYTLTPQSAITTGTQYALKITAASGELYSNETSISITAREPEANELVVLEVEANPAVTGGLTVTVAGAEPGKEYRVTAVTGREEMILYDQILTAPAEEGQWAIPVVLQKNGLVLPLSAYGLGQICVTVSGPTGSDREYFQGNYFNQHADMTLTRTGAGTYSFTLTGCNMLLDIYEQTTPGFSLKCFDFEQHAYVDITNVQATRKRNYFQGESSYVEFSGDFTASPELKADQTYALSYGDEILAITSTISGAETEELHMRRLGLDPYDNRTNSFALNFGQLWAEISLAGATENIASIVLYDLTADAVAAQTEATGIPGENGWLDFSVALEPAQPLDSTHTYQIRAICGGTTVTFGDNAFYNQCFYDDAVILPTYFSVEEPVFAGDTTLTFRFDSYSYEMKNVETEYFATNPIVVMNRATETVVPYTAITPAYRDGDWYVTLTLTTPLTFGTYEYEEYSTFEALPAGGVVLGTVERDEVTRTVTIAGCRNLPEGSYAGILYNTYEEGYGKLADLTVSRQSDTELLVSDFPESLPEGSYIIEIQGEDTYLGTVSAFLSWEGTEASQGPMIRGYGLVAEGSNQYEEIVYQTASDTVALATYLPGYAYVRYSEDANFTGVDYRPIREYYDQNLTLSEGNGEKTVYIQFRKIGGEESPVYQWKCQRVDAVDQQTIVSAEILVDGTTTSLVPEDSAFALELVSASRLVSVTAEFLEADGSAYYRTYPLAYVGQTGEGYLFRCDLNSGNSPFRYYEFRAVRFFLTDISSNTVYEQREKPVLFGGGLILDGWIDENNLYIRDESYIVSGYAPEQSEVVVKWGSGSQSTIERTVTAGLDGRFSVYLDTLPETSSARDARLTVTAKAGNETYTETVYLYVDRTAPKLTELKATLTSEGNAVLTWKCEDANLACYLLWRDDAPVWTAEDGYTSTSYTAANGADTQFRVVAVDKAGNWSEPMEVTPGDTEAPSVPGIPVMTGHGTRSVSFQWTAATDNVAVYAYEIWRDGDKITEVGRDTLAYRDTGLTEDSVYQYQVFARDRAGNRSEAAEVSLSTAALTIENSTDFMEQYVKEGYPGGVEAEVSADRTDDLCDLDAVQAVLRYKAEDAEKWAELELRTPTGRYGYWTGDWMIEELEAGTYTVCFRLTDTEGTEKETECQSVEIVQDVTLPEVSITTPGAGATLGGGKAQEVSFEATDNVCVERVVLSYSTDGENFAKFAELKNETAEPERFRAKALFEAAAELPSGEVTLRAEAYDRRQNRGVAQDVTFTLDNTAPEVPGDFFVGGNSEKITVMWSYPELTEQSDFREFRVYRSESADGAFAYVKELSTIGYYDTVENGIAADKTYYYYVTAVDKWGNESAGTEVCSGQLTDDAQAPVIHSILPADEAVLQKRVEFRVSATDNYMLGACEIAYQQEGGADWTVLASLTPEEATRDHIYQFAWELADVEPGKYTVRFTVEDGSGLTAETTRSYIVRSYSAPEAPVLTAAAEGHKIVRLRWTYGGEEESLRSFALYRGTGAEGELTYLCGLAADTWEYLDEVRFEGDSQSYRYQVVALDQFDARAESAVVSVEAVSNDSEPPVAVIGPESLAYAAVGRPVALTGMASADNDEVVSYAWDFGDGETGTGVKTQHTYTAAGTYIVTLTVTDAYGNTDTDTAEITAVDLDAGDAAYTLLDLTICDAVTAAAIENAEITLDGGGETILLWTDANGAASCVVPNGSYTVGTYADGYLVRTVTLEAAGGTAAHTIGLTNGSIMSGNLTATEMTYDEIVAAGIDPDAPGNQHVYKFAVELTFTVGLKSYKLPYTVFKNANGQILPSDGGGFFTLGGGVSGGGGINVGLFPITENFVLVIYGEARWLKEMYNVELVVINHSATDTLDQVTAQLELPDGLSLADMVDGAQSAVQELGSIGHQETASAHWYVRGDKEGEYNLTAKVRAVSMPYGEIIQQTFTTQEPLKVYAGSALHMTITANDFTERGEQYPVTLRLENVSDKPIYNLSFGVTGVEQFKVLRMGNETVELPIDGEDFEDQFIRTVPELAPGGYMEIEISSTIWFNSIAEVGEAALKTYLNTKGLGALGSFVNVGYYLQDISVVTLEGSTTTIPYTIQVKETERPSFLLTAYETAKDLYEGTEPPPTLMDMMVEVFGSELPIWAQEGAKVVLSLPQGTTDYDVRLTLADGTQDGQTLRNEYVSITSGTDLEMFFENMNTVSIQSGKDGNISINGLKSGDTEINISISDKKGFQTDYKIPLYINGEEVDVKFDLGMNSATGECYVSSDMIGQLVKGLQEKEKATFEENPFLWFASHLELDLKGSYQGTESILSLDKDTLNDLLAETALSYLDVNGGVASLSLDRETLQQVENAKSDTEAVRIILRKLGADAAEEMFSMDRPTYEFLIQVGEDAGKTVSQFGDGQVQVEIPYELQEGERAEDIVVQRVEEDGSYELVPSEYDSAAGLVSFTTGEFSYYRIGLKNQQPPEPEGSDPETPVDPGNQGGSSGPSGGSVQTEVTKNQDGSVTTTVINSATGTITETTKFPDGSALVVKTERDGTTTTTHTGRDGSETVTVQRPGGASVTTERRSDGVVVDTRTESGRTTAQVTIPAYLDGGAEIALPMDLGGRRGTVGIRAVYRDGSEEVLEGSYADGAIQLRLVKSASLEVLNDFVPAVSFSDVPEEAYYYDAVAWAIRNGITAGVTETHFAPNRSCTRAQVLTFLWRAAGSPQPSGSENPFTDVQEGSYYFDAVLWAVEKGITTGVTQTAFAPDATVTRGQAVTFQYRAAGSPAVSGGAAFADVAESDYCYDAVKWAVEQGITLGTAADTFSPGQSCLRGQIVTFLYRDLADA